nr:integrase, catalytic region, zinc finger, CCHC-type, peptidase aspartic, catalytic [Tanacetum cinerariifolium]
WIDREIPIYEGSPITRTKRFQETYKNVLRDIRDQLNAEAETVQIILTGIDNDIYSTVDACPNACEMWKAIERSQQAATKKKGKAIVNSSQYIYDQEPSMVAEDDEMSKDKEIDKLMALISLSFKKIYKPTNNNLRTSSNTSRAIQDKSLRINRSARECQKPKRAKDATYHREKKLLYQELEAHYMYMAQLQEVSPDAADSGPIFDDEPLQKVSNDDHYNVFAMESEHPEQSESVHNAYPTDQDAHNVIINSLDMSYEREEIDQNDDDNDLANEPPESDEVIRLEKESRSKLIDLIRPFDYNKLNNLYDLFIPQREKSYEQRYFLESSRLSHTSVNNGNSKESFNKQTTVLEKRMDESILLDKKCQSSIEIFKVKMYVNTIINGVEFCKEKIANRTFSGYIDPFIQNTIEAKFSPDLKAQLQDKGIVIRVIPTTSVSRPQLKSNPMRDSVLHNNSQGKKHDVEHHRSVKFSKNKTSVTACNDSLNAKTLNLVENVLFIVDSGCSKHMTGNLKLLINFVEKFLGTIKFRNDQIAPILGYGDMVQGAVTVKRVYYVEGLNHNLFSVGQFCDADLEVAFRKSTCYIRDLKGNDLLTGLSKEDFKLKDGENLDKMKEKEQVIRNPSQSVRTRRQLESDNEMCMFVLTEELHQFDRLDIWELVDRPLYTNVINLKWLWKNKRDEENTVIQNKSHLKMESVQISSDPTPECQSMALEHSLVQCLMNCSMDLP